MDSANNNGQMANTTKVNFFKVRSTVKANISGMRAKYTKANS